ncbi:MAG: YdcH family protein [Pseudomonadota bacterium]
MSHTPNELAELFPEHHDRIHDLKASDAHFARLADEHHVVNREIHRGETGVEPMDDVRMEELRKRRLSLLDEIAAQLRAA